MRYDRPKTAADIKLEGITVDFDHVNGVLAQLRLTDANGYTLTIQRLNSYEDLASALLVPAKPKIVKRHAVVGMVAGIKVSELYEHFHEATARVAEFPSEGCAVHVKEVEVPEELALTKRPEQTEDNIPF